MYKTIPFIMLLAISSVSLNAVSANAQVTICHNYGEISVAEPAVAAHLNHGDIVKEDGVSCPTRPGSEPELSDTMAAVVMMRCEAQGNDVIVVSLSTSFDLTGVQPIEIVDCAVALASWLDQGFTLRSVTGGSAGIDGNLHLYTDYLLVGEKPSDPE